MGQLQPPATVADFKAQFIRDFKYGAGFDTVMDKDIQAGLNAAYAVFNPSLFDTTQIGVSPNFTSEALTAYLNAAAHFVVTSLQAAGGLSAVNRALGPNSQGEGMVTNKSVGGVSIGFTWPSMVTDSPALFQFTKTAYGLAYLQVLSLKLVGNVQTILGETQSEQGGPSDV